MGHYYYYNAETGLEEPLYEVPYADPSRGMRPATLSDARKLGAFPSPNTVMDVIDKPAIVQWRRGILADAIIETMLGCDCRGNIDAIKERAFELYDERCESAANQGTAIHAEIENALLKRMGRIDSYGSDPEVDPAIVHAAMTWIEPLIPHVTDVEAVFVNPWYGIGGKIDVVGKQDGIPFIIDWKSVNTKGKKFNGYPESKTPLLAAYAMGYFHTLEGKFWNVFLSRDEPGKIIPVLYQWDEIDEGWEMFLAVYKVWAKKNKYDPREEA